MSKLSRRERDKAKRIQAGIEKENRIVEQVESELMAQRGRELQAKILGNKLARIEELSARESQNCAASFARSESDKLRREQGRKSSLTYETDLNEMFLDRTVSVQEHMAGLKRRAMYAGILTNGTPNRMGLVNTETPMHGKEKATRRGLKKLGKQLRLRYSV